MHILSNINDKIEEILFTVFVRYFPTVIVILIAASVWLAIYLAGQY